MNAITLLKKVPWKTVLKVAGVTAIGASSVMSAMDTDKKTQEFVKTLAEKSTNLMKKGES